jgi:hypothetical protein
VHDVFVLLAARTRNRAEATLGAGRIARGHNIVSLTYSIPTENRFSFF